MISYTTSDTEGDLSGILKLQKANLSSVLNKDEIEGQGFVTISHSLDDLRKLNRFEKHIIAKDDDEVIAYLLAMTQKSKSDIPFLIPMFEVFSKVLFRNKPISSYNYIVVGQVCVGKPYRGQGILDNCYAAYKSHYECKYDFAITEIASTNPRSLNAHKRIGFQEIKRFTDPENTEWCIVLWDWENDK